MDYEFGDYISLAAYILTVAVILLICVIKAITARRMVAMYDHAILHTRTTLLRDQYLRHHENEKFRTKFWTFAGIAVIVTNIIYWGFFA